MRILGLLIVFERADAISLASAYARAPGAKEPTTLSGAPGRVRTDTGVLLGDRPLPWATGAPNNNLVRYLLGKKSECRILGGLFRHGTGECAVHRDTAPAVATPQEPMCGPAHLCAPADLWLRCSTPAAV